MNLIWRAKSITFPKAKRSAKLNRSDRDHDTNQYHNVEYLDFTLNII